MSSRRAESGRDAMVGAVPTIMAVWIAAALWGGAAACGGEGTAPEITKAPRPAAPAHDDRDHAPDDGRYVAVIAALEAVDVASRHAGTLVAVEVRPGDQMNQDEILAKLDEKPMREALRLAQAKRRSAQAILAQRDVEVGEAERALKIEERLAAGGVSAKNSLEEARFALQKARKIRDHAQSLLAEQNAQIAQLERQLSEATITAPFTGTVSLRYRDPGSLVSAGTPVVRLIRTDSLWVKFAVPADAAPSFTVGDTITTETESPRASLPATIRHISPELDPAARMIFIEAELAVPDDLEGQLRSGSPAWVTRPAPEMETE